MGSRNKPASSRATDATTAATGKKPVATRSATLKALVEAAEGKKGSTFDVPFRGKRISLHKISVAAELPLFRIQSGRTHRAQCRYLETHPVAKDFFDDPEEPKVQKAQYEILLGMITEKGLDTDLKERKQLNPIVLTADGTVVDGNRRLAALRQKKEDYVEAVVLPGDALSQEIYETELEFQMQRETKAEYDWIDQALHLEYGINKLEETEEKLARKMRLGVAQVHKQLETLSLVKQYLDFINAPGEYHKVPSTAGGGAKQSFEEMVSGFGVTSFKRKTEQEKRVIRRVCFAAIKDEKGYKDIRTIIQQMSANAPKLAQKVRERVPKEKRPKPKPTPTPKKKQKGQEKDDPFADLASTADQDDVQDLEDLSDALATPAGTEEVFVAIEEAAAEERDAKKLQLPLQRVSRAIKELEQIELTKADDLKEIAKALGTLDKGVDKLRKRIEKLQE